MSKLVCNCIKYYGEKKEKEFKISGEVNTNYIHNKRILSSKKFKSLFILIIEIKIYERK